MLETVVEDTIWAIERSIRFHGVWLRTRTTVIRRPAGLWVHSAGPPTAETRTALTALGPVRWIVVPNRFHHLEAMATAAHYPEARIVGPQTACARNPALELHATFDDIGQPWDEIEILPLRGVPFLDESLFFHRPTQTLIGTDVAMSATHKDHWSWRVAGRMMGLFEKVRVPPDIRLRVRPNAENRAALESIFALPVQRLLLAHTDPIVDAPMEKLREAWQFALS